MPFEHRQSRARYSVKGQFFFFLRLFFSRTHSVGNRPGNDYVIIARMCCKMSDERASRLRPCRSQY